MELGLMDGELGVFGISDGDLNAFSSGPIGQWTSYLFESGVFEYRTATRS
jgi:hypothetical protein